MVTTSRPNRSANETRSGGKLTRSRVKSCTRTPYDRPRELTTGNPNWFTSTTHSIATGAGKFLSSVLGFDTISSSSSSSSSGSGSVSDYEVDINDSNLHDISCEVAEKFDEEAEPVGDKTGRKCEIEQLLLQEKFSREECDRLIEIIRSRVMECPKIKYRQDEYANKVPEWTAVMEAKRWAEKNKSGTTSKSELDYGTCCLNLAMFPDALDSECGSPVDMAKSYMRNCPQWASPSLNKEVQDGSSERTYSLSKEETQFPPAGTPLSSSRLGRNSSNKSDLWSIWEEIRRVRTKASEDLLGDFPSRKLDASPLSLEGKSRPISLVVDRLEAALGDRIEPSSLAATKLLYEPSYVAGGSSASHGFPVLGATQDGFQNGALYQQNQILEATKSIGGKQEDVLRSGHQSMPSDNANNLLHCHEMATSPSGEGACMLLCEASNEVIPQNEGGPHDSYGLKIEEQSQDSEKMTPSYSSSDRKTRNRAEKQQQGKKQLTRYNRKSKVRHK